MLERKQLVAVHAPTCVALTEFAYVVLTSPACEIADLETGALVVGRADGVEALSVAASRVNSCPIRHGKI